MDTLKEQSRASDREKPRRGSQDSDSGIVTAWRELNVDCCRLRALRKVWVCFVFLPVALLLSLMN